MYTKPRTKLFKNNSVMSHQWATADSPYIRQYTCKGYFINRPISVKNMIYLYNLYYDYRYKKGRRLYLWSCLTISKWRPYQTGQNLSPIQHLSPMSWHRSFSAKSSTGAPFRE